MQSAEAEVLLGVEALPRVEVLLEAVAFPELVLSESGLLAPDQCNCPCNQIDEHVRRHCCCPRQNLPFCVLLSLQLVYASAGHLQGHN